MLEENNRIVVVEEHNTNVVVVVEENYRILWPLKLYQCATCYHFLSLHSAPDELTRVGSAPFARNRLEYITCQNLRTFKFRAFYFGHFLSHFGHISDQNFGHFAVTRRKEIYASQT